MSDGWGTMLMEAAENAGHMLMAALEGVGEMVGMAASAAKDKVGGLVSGIKNAPTAMARAGSSMVSGAMDRLRGNSGPSVAKSQEIGVQSFMPPSQEKVAAMPPPSIESARSYDSPEHGVSAYALAPRGQDVSMRA